jgi:hypothetical protein
MRARLSELVGEELPADWDAEYAERYREVLAGDLEAVDGVAEALDVIEQAGLATCVASSASQEKMALTLGKTGLLNRFSGRIYSATDPSVAAGKPAPDCSSMRRSAWGSTPQAVRWSRTVPTDLLLPLRPAWCRSASRGAWSPPIASPSTASRSSSPWQSSRHSSYETRPELSTCPRLTRQRARFGDPGQPAGVSLARPKRDHRRPCGAIAEGSTR